MLMKKEKIHGCTAWHMMLSIKIFGVYLPVKLCFVCKVPSFWKRHSKVVASLRDVVRMMY